MALSFMADEPEGREALLQVGMQILVRLRVKSILGLRGGMGVERGYVSIVPLSVAWLSAVLLCAGADGVPVRQQPQGARLPPRRRRWARSSKQYRETPDHLADLPHTLAPLGPADP